MSAKGSIQEKGLRGCTQRPGWGWTTLRRSHFVTSGILPVPALLFWRFCCFGYYFAVSIWFMVNFVPREHPPWFFFVFFTNTTFLVEAVYFTISFVVTLIAVASKADEIDEPAGIGWRLFQILYELATPNAIVVTIVFWTVLAGPNSIVDINILVHMVNSPPMLLETLFNRIRHVPSHVLFHAMFSVAYMCWAWIGHAGTGRWVYPFLDWNNRYAAAWYIGLGAGLAIMFLLICVVSYLRDRFLNCQARRRKQTYHVIA
eukprot:TRINITY_DN1391_c0_g1_i1.p2 TRINITY_DN1391_c0_g1~~TRINITY_DN1391_c0_g1_i1.p2  ORF type:complete len:259 (+),score=29.37 TRINITY_DN1391_c0_g1_i1:143-919(+)